MTTEKNDRHRPGGTRLCLTGVFILMFAFATGCQSDDGGAEDAEAIGATAQSDVIGQTPPAGALVGEETVEVSLLDYGIVMPDTLPAGVKDFKMTNRGDEEHALVIEGEGLRAQTEAQMAMGPGDMMTLRVDLAPGTYQVWCPEEDHAARGMTRPLVVVAAEGASPSLR